MGWPQWVVLTIFGIKLMAVWHLHGRYGKYNGPSLTLDYVIIVWVLWMGGFFS